MFNPTTKRLLKLLLVFWLPMLAASLAGPLFWTDQLCSLLLAASLSWLFNISSRPGLWLRLWHTLLVLIYLLALFFVLFKALLYDFTGQGFTNEVYYHLSWESFKVGFSEYSWQLSLLFVVMLGFVLLVERFSRHQGFPATFWSCALAITGIVLSLLYSPIGQFLQGLHSYRNTPALSAIDERTLAPYIQAGFINTPAIPKKSVVTASGDDPQNLILIYLESFNQFLLDHPDFNHLTKNLQQPGDGFYSFQHRGSSSVTIEGLISSQCGTLLTMSAANDTFMKKSSTMSELPCLADVLSEAGYQQYYLGGAKMEFAGKGAFLKAHGYDHVWGMEYWREQGRHSEQNVWGLSDSDLFDEAVQVIQQAAQDPPYNLTLLTLGTHIPGYVYPGCESIDFGDRFLDAIACTDLLVGRFIEQLDRQQLLENTLVVIVADHGVFPNSKMRALFGDLVDDKRLVGITNHQPANPDTPISSYDLAPTILEWLGVDHSARFLDGKPMSQHVNEPHPHITRYRDWLDGTLHKNPRSDDCQAAIEPDKLLNRCQKDYLKAVTKHILQQYGVEQSGPFLGCELTLAVDLTADEKQLLINGQNRYDQFHSGGYNLTSRQYDSGHFAFSLSKQGHMINTRYAKLTAEAAVEPVFATPEEAGDGAYTIEIIVHSDIRLYIHQPDQQVIEHPLIDEFSLNVCDN